MLPGLISKKAVVRVEWGSPLFDPPFHCEAIFSSCMAYRYWLEWRWSDAPPMIVWMLNPSTADHQRLDNTVKGLIKRAKAWGYGAVIVINLFAYRATQPEDMKDAADPIGPANDDITRIAIARAIDGGFPIICGWGNHGEFMSRDVWAMGLAAELECPLSAFAITGAGQPQHPLYIGHDVRAMPWRA